MTEKRCICLQLEEYIADNMIELCEKRGDQQDRHPWADRKSVM